LTEDDSSESEPVVNLVSLTPDQSRLVWRIIAVAAVAGLWWITRRSFAQTNRRWAEHEFALVLLAMLLLSERSWKHHYVTVLPSFVALFGWLAFRRQKSGWRSLAPWLTAVAALLPIVASQDVLKPIAGNYAVELLQAYGVYAWSAAMLIVAHVLVRRDLLSDRRSV
jgi:alpha-1,2-mannosyltransferase